MSAALGCSRVVAVCEALERAATSDARDRLAALLEACEAAIAAACETLDVARRAR